jgi:hypothetical protein
MSAMSTVCLAEVPWWTASDRLLPLTWVVMWLILTLGIAAVLALEGRTRIAMWVALGLGPIAGVACGVASAWAWLSGQPRHVVEGLTVCGVVGIAVPVKACILALLSVHMIPMALQVFNSLRGRGDCDEARRMRAADIL